METQYKWIIPTVVLGLLAPLLTGCPKTTGGGCFLSYDEYDGVEIPVTFGFTANPTGEDTAKGRFMLVAHHLDHSVTTVHGAFDETTPNGGCGEGNTTRVAFGGECSLDGHNGFELYIECSDLGEPGPSAGDNIYASVSDEDGVLCGEWQGELVGGSLQIHHPEH